MLSMLAHPPRRASAGLDARWAWETDIAWYIYQAMNLLDSRMKGGEVWFEDDRVVKYSLAYINPAICAADNGRVLGYGNAHDRHHRHFMGAVADFEFESY